MQHKTLSILSLLILFAFSAKNSFGQYAGMGAFRSSQNRQFVNQQMTRNLGLRGIDDNENYKYTFNVILKDSSTQAVNSIIYTDTVLHKNYLLFVDKKFPKSDSAHRFQKIYPDQTVNISRVDLYSDLKNVVIGKPNDSCWMFKVISGPVSVYSFLSEQDGYFSDPSSFIGLQLNNGPIFNFSEENLKTMIGQDTEALENIEKKDFLKAIKKYNQHASKAAKK
jgi:hypothetical protein